MLELPRIVFLAGLLVLTFLVGSCGGQKDDPPVLEVEPPEGIEVHEGGDQGQGVTAIAEPLSPVYRLTASRALRHPLTLKFSFRASEVTDPSMLRVGYRDSREEDWRWVRGEADDDSYSVQTSHLSEWQLQELQCADEIDGEDGFEVEVESSKPDDPLLYACAHSVEGKPGLTVFNNRSLGLEFPVLDGVEVVETGHRTVVETAWGPANSLQYGSPWLLVPGDGFVTLAFDSIPEEIEFDATNSAFVFDLLLSTNRHLDAGFFGCAHNISETARVLGLSVKTSLKKILLDGITSCGGGIGEILGFPALVEKAWASIGSLTDSALVSFSARQPAMLPRPEAALKLPGPVEFDGIAPVKVGMTRSDVDAATGLHFVFTLNQETCAELVPSPGMGQASEDDYLPGVSLMIVSAPGRDLLLKGRVARVDVSELGYTTAAGLGIGSTETEVRTVYEPFVRESPHAYVPGGRYLIVKSPDPALARFRIVFETDGTRVTSFRAGRLPEVEFVEHCL